MQSNRVRLAAAAAALLVLNAGSLAIAAPRVLHSQGPLITSANGGTGNIAGQPLSKADNFPLTATLNGATTGIGATTSQGTAIADDFTVPDGGWDIDSMTFYGFQTYPGSATTYGQTVTTLSVNLWNTTPYLADSPDLPAGTPIPQPMLSTPLTFDVTGQGTFVAHRVSGNSTNTIRPIYSWTVPADGLPNQGKLDPGHYWLQVSFDGAGPQTPTVFVPLVSPRDQVDSAPNARLLNAPFGGNVRTWFEGREGFGSSAMPDGRAYTFPFELVGTPEPASLVGAGAAVVVAAIRRRRA